MDSGNGSTPKMTQITDTQMGHENMVTTRSDHVFQSTSALEILRETVRILRYNLSGFMAIGAFICPVSAVLLSNVMGNQGLVKRVVIRLLLVAKSCGLPLSSFVEMFCFKFAESGVSALMCFPLYVTLLLILKAAVVYSVDCTYSRKLFDSSKCYVIVRKIWERILGTYLFVIGSLMLFLVLLAGVSTLFPVIGFTPDLTTYMVIIFGLFFSVFFANAVIICDLSMVISVLEDVSGAEALLRSSVLISGQAKAGSMIFLCSTIWMAFFEGLFEHRVKTLSYGDGSLRIWEGPLLVVMYSFVLLVHFMMSTVFYFSCKSTSLKNDSNSFSTASSFRSLKYDVFLSFRGKDTRKTYVGHLYNTLEKRGIYTYKDDKTLPRGDTIHPSLLKAIEESQIAIVVFSENYADSSWCLRELDCIMERWRKKKLIVMPIFYNVTTSDVKDKDGKFAKHILTIDSKYSKYFDSWRLALVDATSIAGWETEFMDGNEADGIKVIVSEVSKKLKPLDLNAQENLIGIEPRMDELIPMLNIGSGGVHMVGIWGIGGGGKTTLASSVYKKISSEFEASCLVENISKEASNLKKLQKKILSDILGDKIKVSSVEEGKDLMESRLRHREKVLIVLDDVDNRAQLEALAGSHSWFGPETRIIITSRNKELLNDVNMIYDIKFLTDNEAIWLFHRHALRKRVHIEDDDDEIVELSKEVVFYARGLPLALKVLGLSLCNDDMSEWRSTLDRLQKIPEDGILEVLRISYDGLNPNRKELFLDISCFFRHWPKDEAIVILEACALYPVKGIKELELKALITTANGRFDMHDLIQDMGHHIVQGDHPDNPEKRSRIWQDVDIENMCSWDETMENRETRALHAPDYEAPSKLLKAVSNMKNLRSLYVCQEVTRTAQEPLFMSNRLRWISWKHYPASLLSRDFQPTNLVGLVLQNSLLQELWRGSKKLPVLKLLDLSDSKNLTTTPDLGGFKKLERLVLSGCTNLTHMHPSLGRHEGLVYLNLDGCDKLAMFPAIVKMQSLDTLILSRCSRLRMFPDIQLHMVSLKHLNLDHSGIEALPLSIGKYCTNLVSISVIGCDHLMNFECNFQLLNQTWSISVGGHVN